MNTIKSSLVALFVLLIFAPVGSAAEFDSCAERSASGQTVAVTCTLRLEPGESLKSLKVMAGQEVLEPISYADQPIEIDHFLLMDTSKSLSASDFMLQKKTAQAILNLKMEKRKVALATFSGTYKEIAPLGSASELIELAVPNLKADGQTTELLAAVTKAIDNLGQSTSQLKTVFVFSDGKFEDTGFSLKEVVDKAKSAKVKFVVILPRDDARSLTDAQGVRRLADETGGFYFVVDGSAKIENFEKSITEHYARVATVNFVAKADSTNLNLTNADGTTGNLIFQSKLFELTAGTEPAKIEPTAPLTTLEKIDLVFDDLISWLKASYVNQALAGVGVLLFSGLVIWLVKRRSMRRAQRGAVSDLPAPIAFLEFLDGRSTREPIYGSSTRIGRASDNDVVLNHDTVHRHHAVLTCVEASRFEVTDLQTANGVKVNGARITRQRLSDGDMMEFGEVRLRFISV